MPSKFFKNLGLEIKLASYNKNIWIFLMLSCDEFFVIYIREPISEIILDITNKSVPYVGILGILYKYSKILLISSPN